ncbi:MAG: thioredoxin family protein [Methylomonas sp.]|nr:MAG: thioredoxin family protein [Methylobacter sp.]PPD34911.1 MAG: thioredoxin family protein [Methylomonas sp.]
MRLVLLGTEGCHLCEEAKQLLHQLLTANKSMYLVLEEIDIAEHEEWQNEYAVRIPVFLQPDSGTELGWPFGYQELEKFVNGLQPHSIRL